MEEICSIPLLPENLDWKQRKFDKVLAPNKRIPVHRTSRNIGYFSLCKLYFPPHHNYNSMSHSIIEEQEFRATDFTQGLLPAAEFEHCSFIDCNLAGVNLSGVIFADCSFINCDLSNSSLTNTSFQEVEFRNCKLLGLRFEECNSFLLRFKFEYCILNFSSFFKLKLKGTRFIGCRLEEVDLSEADLSQARFPDCDFSGTIFNNTNLEQADLSTSRNFSIDPEKNRLRKARFSNTNIAGLLDKYQIVIK